MDRRALLQWLVASGGLAALNRLSAQDLSSVGDEAHQRLALGDARAGVLSAAELRTVTVAAELIIPRTKTPGATDVGVAEFVDTMLADWYPEADVQHFREGLAQLDADSNQRFGTSFAEASADRQVTLLAAIDAEVDALRRSDPGAANAHWYGMFKFLTVWGYCTSEKAMRDVFHALPRPLRYDGAAPVR